MIIVIIRQIILIIIIIMIIVVVVVVSLLLIGAYHNCLPCRGHPTKGRVPYSNITNDDEGRATNQLESAISWEAFHLQMYGLL